MAPIINHWWMGGLWIGWKQEAGVTNAPAQNSKGTCCVCSSMRRRSFLSWIQMLAPTVWYSSRTWYSCLMDSACLFQVGRHRHVGCAKTQWTSSILVLLLLQNDLEIMNKWNTTLSEPTVGTAISLTLYHYTVLSNHTIVMCSLMVWYFIYYCLLLLLFIIDYLFTVRYWDQI